MKQLLFIGRLVPEKWVDLLIRAFLALPERIQSTTELLIAGSWDIKYESFLRALSPHRNIRFLGKITAGERAELFKKVDAVVVPSRFVETFGLVAAEAVVAGLPVIWFGQKWIDAFLLISAEYISSNDGATTLSLSRALQSFLSDEYSTQTKEEIQRICQQKTLPTTWLEAWQKRIPKHTKKVLLVTDFSERLGGIEAHVYESAEILREAGYIVEIFTSQQPYPSLKTLFLSAMNYRDTDRICSKIRDFQPDVIWCHSIVRALWPWVMRAIAWASATRLITLHDFGIFTARPFRYDLLQDSQKANLIGFASTSPVLETPLALLKWIGVKWMIRVIRGFDHIFVPNESLLTMTRAWFDVDPRLVSVLSHFIFDGAWSFSKLKSMWFQLGQLLSKFSPWDSQSVTQAILYHWQNKGSSIVHFAYFNALDRNRHNRAYISALKDADFLLPDGIALRLIARRYGYSFHNLNGTDFIPQFLRAIASLRPGVYIYGGGIGVTDQIRHYVQQVLWCQVVFAEHGYQPLDIADLPQSHGPKILLVGRWSPLQETWVQEHEGILRERGFLVFTVGGLFDFWSGSEKRAPQWMRILHCEWLYRSVFQPKKNLKKSWESIRVLGYLARIWK